MLTFGSGSKLTFIEVLTVNNYKKKLSNIQILTFINISNVKSPFERIPFIKLQTQSKLYSISSLQITGERERNVIECVVFIIHIMIVFHSLIFIESNLQRREYHFVNR